MAAELDGPRLEAARRAGQAAGRVPARLWRRRQRPDRHRPRLAGLLPDTAFVSPHAPEPCGQAPMGRQWFTLTFRDPERALGRRQQGRAGARTLPRRRTRAPQAAAVRAGAGRLQPGHHDGAACRPAPRRAAGRDRRLFRPVRAAGRRRARRRSRARSSPVRRCCWCMATRTSSSRAQALFQGAQDAGGARGAGRVAHVAPASATASTRRACAMAANSWRAASACAGKAAPGSRRLPRFAHSLTFGRFTILSRSPIDCGVPPLRRAAMGCRRTSLERARFLAAVSRPRCSTRTSVR